MNRNSSQRSSLLVDYSKNAAATTSTEELRQRLSLRVAANSCFQSALDVSSIHSISARTGTTATSDPTKPVTFQLRRSLVNRESFMGYLKFHFSESDLDLGATNSVGAPSNEDKRCRRNTLKKTFRKTQSMRQLNLDSSPISLANSIHEQPRTNILAKDAKKRTLPSRSRTCDGAIGSTFDGHGSFPVHKTKRSIHSLPKRSYSRGQTKAATTAASEHAPVGPHRSQVVRKTDAAVKEVGVGPLPRKSILQVNNRRSMMRRQASFITGSRIRDLKA